MEMKVEESQEKNETKKTQKRTIRRNKRSKTTINSGASNQTKTSQSSSGKTLLIVQKQRMAIQVNAFARFTTSDLLVNY